MHKIGDREYIHRERNRIKMGIIRKWIKKNAQKLRFDNAKYKSITRKPGEWVRLLQYTNKQYKYCGKWEIVQENLENHQKTGFNI